MSKELNVSSGRHETRVAILEDDQVVELFHEREKEYSLAGSIHKGRVTRVLPGMQSAFVDIGLDRDAVEVVAAVCRTPSFSRHARKQRAPRRPARRRRPETNPPRQARLYRALR